MLDAALRPIKDTFFDPLCRLVPGFISPGFLTLIAFVSGLASCYFATLLNFQYSLSLWFINRGLDCLDGALARRRNQASDLGGFLDLLCDFIVYALIPISCALGVTSNETLAKPWAPIVGLLPSSSEWQLTGAFGTTSSSWLSVAAVEASFFINNFVLFFIAALLEKSRASADKVAVKGLTTVAMRPALIEGFESGLFFTLMLAMPSELEVLCWAMTGLVAIGTLQRVFWVIRALSRDPTNKAA